MNRDFWLERWQLGQIGFHRSDVNPRLVTHRAALPQQAGARIFVPLCGKSRDLAWLAQQGYRVAGVELSEVAVRDFFLEHDLKPKRTAAGGLEVYEAGAVRVFCGDFFALTPETLGPVDGLYDRAALVALPPELRERYAQQLSALLPEHVQGLLVAFDYRQSEMSGPPFSVPEAEVRALYEPAFGVELLASYDILEEEPRFRQAGLTSLSERVYALKR